MTDGEGPPSPGEAFDGAGDGEVVGEVHAAAEGAEPGPSREAWWVRAARSTRPNPPLDEVGGFEDIRDNWSAYLTRGVQKGAGVDDAEAWVDVLKGVLGLALERADASEQAPEEAEGEDPPGTDELLRVQEAYDDEIA